MTKNSKKLVVKENSLVNASYTLNVTEQRTLLLALTKIKARDEVLTANDVLTVSIKEYSNQFGVSEPAAWEALTEATKSLFNRYLTFREKDKKSETYARWVSQVTMEKDTGIVKLWFSPVVCESVSALKQKFSSYHLDEVSDLTSFYAIRLYEIFISWQSTKKTPKIEIGELRNLFGLKSSEYTRMSDFKRRVLDAAIDQINEHTNITAKYDQHKEGRKIVGFSFSFRFKEKPKTLTVGNTVINDDYIEKYREAGESKKQARERLIKQAEQQKELEINQQYERELKTRQDKHKTKDINGPTSISSIIKELKVNRTES